MTEPSPKSSWAHLIAPLALLTTRRFSNPYAADSQSAIAIALRYGIVGTTARTAPVAPADTLPIRTIGLVRNPGLPCLIFPHCADSRSGRH
jgi:hypothetical protein